MERGTNVPMTAGGLVGKLYAHTPHHRIDQMHAATTTNLNLLAYKRCIEVAAALFVLGLVSMASCWGFLTWVGLPHLLCVLYPYCNQVLHPTFYFIYTIVVAVFTFVNLCGGLSHGCLIVPVLVEMPICGRFFLLVEMAVAVAPLAPDAGVFWTDDPAAPAPPRGVIGRGPEGMEST